MSTKRVDDDRITKAWLAEGPTVLAERVLDAALHEVHLTRQRRGSPAPWRTLTMNRLLAATAAVIVVAVVGGGYLALRGQGVGGPAVSPSPSAAPSPSPQPDATPSSAAPMGTFTSERYGFTVAYPAGWEVHPSLNSWKAGEAVTPTTTGLDRFSLQGSDREPFFGIASQPLPDATTAGEWMDGYYRRNAESFGSMCVGDPEGWQPITIDGVEARIAYSRCDDAQSPVAEAVLVADGQGYVISGDRDVVERILPTLRLP